MDEVKQEQLRKQDDTTVVDNDRSIPPKTAAANLQEVINQLLQFLSTASNGVLGWVGVGLLACTYLVLGRVGLILIGILGGVILHATWEGEGHNENSLDSKRKENSLDILKRVLHMPSEFPSEDTAESDVILDGQTFEDFQSETKAALTEFVEAIIRDYVKWWYSPIIPTDEAFPTTCRRTLVRFFRSIANRLYKKRPADVFLDFLTNTSSIIIVFLSELSSAINATQSLNLAPADAIGDYLLTSPNSNLANVLNERQQRRKFKMVAEDILENFLDRSSLACDPARVFLREILAGVVLEMSLNSCSKPEWLNGWIVFLLEDGEPDISQAIDAGMSPSSRAESSTGPDPVMTEAKEVEKKRHRKQLSQAEEAMEEAMAEAKRLSQLIHEAEAKDREQGIKHLDVPSTSASQDFKESIENLASSGELSRGNVSSDDSIAMITPRTASIQSSPMTPAKDISDPMAGFSQSLVLDQLNNESASTTFSPRQRSSTASLTLHNAHITLHDDSASNDKGKIRVKPAGDFWVQIEPESSQFPGWMILRKYADFETLHEVLRRIAAISGVTSFMEQHSELPNWRNHTRASLRGELERYLRDACWNQQLAESEGMRRFLEREQAQNNTSGKNFAGIGWPSPAAFETMGKGMLDALASAPKGAATGGKAVLGGMTGVLGNIGSLGGPKRRETSPEQTSQSPSGASIGLPRSESRPVLSGTRRGSEREDNSRAAPVMQNRSLTMQTQQASKPRMERNASYVSVKEGGPMDETATSKVGSTMSTRSVPSSNNNSRDPSLAPTKTSRTARTADLSDLDTINLPPPPSEIDDYTNYMNTESVFINTPRTSTSNAPSIMSPARTSTSSTRPPPTVPPIPPKRPRKEAVPLTEAETRVAVELLFAMVNELYTLSSAWNIRRTLLTAAKTFLLRPSNPSLLSIQTLIQDSLLNSTTSDGGMATHLRKLRANTIPTEAELAQWPAELTVDEKEQLRIKARKLLLERGVPAALSGVMGQAATSEALGRVFDCLQVERLARGFMFGVLLQGVKALTH